MTHIKLSFFQFLLFGVIFYALSAPHPSYALASERAPTQADKEAKSKSNQQAEYHFSIAQGYSNEGETDKAIEEYKLALIFDPNSALLHARLSAEFIKKGMLSSAMESAKEAVRQDPNFVDARLILGGLYSAVHENQSAVEEYDRVLKMDPKNEEALIYKAQVLMEDGKVSQAAVALRQYTQKNQDSVLGFYYLARAEQLAGHFKQAVQAYQKAISIRPSFAQSSLGLGYLYEEHQMPVQAIAVYKSLFDQNRDVMAANRLATLYLKQEKYTQAVPFLKAIQESDPEDFNAQVKLGLVQMELKQFDDAIGAFKKILEKNPDSDRIHYYLGSIYQERKQSDLAIAEFKAIQNSSKLYPDAVLQTAYFLKQSHRLSEARSYVADAIQKASKVPSLYIFQASLEEDDKQPEKAIKILEAAINNFPSDEKMHYYLGSLYDRQGLVDKGLEHMEAILKLNPDNVDAMNYIGYTWTQRGVRLNDAESLLRRALVLRPQNGFIQDSWGWYLFIRGRVREAVVELEKAVKMKPNESTILEHLGDAYLRSNLREKAVDQYLVAGKYAENEEVRRKIETKVQNIRKGSSLRGSQQSSGSKSENSPEQSDSHN
jgi:tetratricopeptide (TPR) repeat protein